MAKENGKIFPESKTSKCNTFGKENKGPEL